MSQRQPDRGWPGQSRSDTLEERYASVISEALEHGVNAEQLVENWLAAHRIPQRLTDGDAESYLVTVIGGALYAALGSALESSDNDASVGLWSEAWLLGAHSAAQASRAAHIAVKSSDGDAHVQCGAGHEHWGRYGAAGLLIRHGHGARRAYLLQRHAGGEAAGTWGVPGGAIGSDESTLQGALREAHEELGALPPVTHSHAVVDDHGGWSYTTHVMDADEQFTPHMDGETPGEVSGWAWLTDDDLRKMPLHPGFEATWPVLRDSTEDTITGPATGAKAWRSVRGARPAPLPPDPWQEERDRMHRSGIPKPLAGVLSSAYFTWLSGPAGTSLDGIVRTYIRAIAAVLQKLRDGLITPRRAIRWIKDILTSRGRAKRIAATESAQAQAEAARLVYLLEHSPFILWVTMHDGKVCPACEKNEQAGPVPLGEAFPSGDVAPPLHPFCIVGSTRIRAFSQVNAVTERDYHGEVVKIRTSLGYGLTCTPNHPVATSTGWVSATKLQAGDYILSSTSSEWEVLGADKNVNDVPPCIEDVAKSFSVVLPAVPVAAKDFHGDGAGSEVCVVRSDRFLVSDDDAAIAQNACKYVLSRRGVPAISRYLMRDGASAEFIKSLLFASNRIMCSSSQEGAVFWRRSSHAHVHSGTAISRFDTGFDQPVTNDLPADTDGFCERLLAFAGNITTDKVIDVQRDVVTTHVYNLDTADGWYISNGIVSHNCRCKLMPLEGPRGDEGVGSVMKANPWLVLAVRPGSAGEVI